MIHKGFVCVKHSNTRSIFQFNRSQWNTCLLSIVILILLSLACHQSTVVSQDTSVQSTDSSSNSLDNDSASQNPTSHWLWPIAEDPQLGLRLNDTFGPRIQTAQNRYDFHRGIDISREVGTPIYAIADGEISIAGEHPSYQDTTIQIKHPQEDGSFLISHYTHLSEVIDGLEVGQYIQKGEVIAYSGQGSSSYPHLHFELRHSLDGLSFQRNAIHPLQFLPYLSEGGPSINLDELQRNADGLTEITATISISSLELDLLRVQLTITTETGSPIIQKQLDFNEWNATHTDTSILDNPELYDIIITPEDFNVQAADEWRLRLQFIALDIPTDQSFQGHFSISDTKGHEAQLTFEIPQQ